MKPPGPPPWQWRELGPAGGAWWTVWETPQGRTCFPCGSGVAAGPAGAPTKVLGGLGGLNVSPVPVGQRSPSPPRRPMSPGQGHRVLKPSVFPEAPSFEQSSFSLPCSENGESSNLHLLSEGDSCCDSVSDVGLFFPLPGWGLGWSLRAERRTCWGRAGCATGRPSCRLHPAGLWGQAQGAERGLVSAQTVRRVGPQLMGITVPASLPPCGHRQSQSPVLFLPQTGLFSITLWPCSLLSTAHL